MKKSFYLSLFVILSLGFFSFAQSEEIQIKHNGLTLNGTLTLAEGKTLGDGVVVMTHGTLLHKFDREIAWT